MKKNWIFVIVGMVIYIGAFFPIAVREVHASSGSSGYPGWFCAFTTLVAPWGHNALSSIREGPVEYFSILFSGWINPVFLITLLVALIWRKSRLGFVLVVLLMFTACWIVFYKLALYPREGYFVWTLGMLLVLFSAPEARARHERPKLEPAVDNRISIP